MKLTWDDPTNGRANVVQVLYTDTAAATPNTVLDTVAMGVGEFAVAEVNRPPGRRFAVRGVNTDADPDVPGPLSNIVEVEGGGAGANDVTWQTSDSFVTITGNDVEKTGLGSGGDDGTFYWASGGWAMSQQSVASGAVEFRHTVANLTYLYTVALHGATVPVTGTNPNGQVHIRALSAGDFHLYEGTTFRHEFAASVGQVLALRVTSGGAVELVRNGTVIHTLASPALTYPLRAHALFRDVGGRVNDAEWITP